MAKPESTTGKTPAQHIDARIKELGDWRGALLSKLRAIIKRADPEVVETWKWRGVPVWEDGGILCTGETYKAVVKMTFAHGAKLADPAKLFNSSMGGGTRRAIDIKESESIDESALIDLVRAAVVFNTSKSAARKKPAAGNKPATKTSATKTSATKTSATKTSAAKKPSSAKKSAKPAKKRAAPTKKRAAKATK